MSPSSVLLDRAQAHQPGLDVVAHALLVDVQAGRALLEQGAALDQPVQVLHALGVDRVGVDVGAFGQVDLRAAHVQEGVGVSGRQLARLFGVDHVVGHRRHQGGQFGPGPECLERFEL